MAIFCPKGWFHDWETIAVYSDNISYILEDRICMKCGEKRDKGALRAIEQFEKEERIRQRRKELAMRKWEEGE